MLQFCGKTNTLRTVPNVIKRRLFLLFDGLGTNHLPDCSCECAAAERSYDEYPELLEGCTACEQGGSDRTGGVHGSACVSDANQMNQDKREADGQTSKIAGALEVIGRTQNNEYEYACEYQLSYESLSDADAVLTYILAHAAGCEGEQDSSADDCADDLENHVHAGVLTAHAARQPNAQSDGGIDVAARNAADGISHCNYCKTECKSRSNYAGNADAGRCATQADGSAATHKNQNHGSDHFS